jgi:peptidoglycan/LPS O-acetylase OafA/YrhL
MPAAACWLGRVSYSVYLLHPLVLILVARTGWPWGVRLAALAAGTLLVSAVTYRFVEEPGIHLGRWIERRWLSAARRDPAPETVPARRAA